MASLRGGTLASSFLYAAFFFSGFTALLYEIVWQRLLIRITGATMPATVAIFSLFMLGLALGAFFSIKYCEKSIRPWKMYALAELLVALMGLSILYLSEQGSLEFVDLHLSSISGMHLVRANLVASFTVIASAHVVVACAAMGSAFNFGLRALLTQDSKAQIFSQEGFRAQSINQAYTWNICGAAFGSICGAFFCLPHLGLTATAGFACAVNVLLALSLWFAKLKQVSADPDQTVQTEQKTTYLPLILALIFSFSFVSMSLEITWMRLLNLICGSSTYAMGSVLTVILVSLAIGATLAGRVRSWSPPTFSFLVLNLCAGGAAFLLSASLLFLQYSTWGIVWMQSFLARLGCSSACQFFLPRILLTCILISGTMVFLGFVTPLLIKLANREKQSVKVTALILTLSTAGSICGALCTEFLIIPNHYFVSGIETALICSICSLSLLALVCGRLAFASFNMKGLIFVSWSVVLSLVITLLHPAWQPRLMSLGPSFVQTSGKHLLSFAKFKSRYEGGIEQCLFYKEGSSATVTVETNEQANVIYLKSNGKVESSLPIDWRKQAPTSDYKTQLFMGVVPMLFHEQGANNLKALTIGFGSGITSGLLLSFERISHLTTCEIEPVIYQCSHFFDNSNFRPLREEWLENGRVKPQSADARAYLNQHRGLFDIIVSQPSEPWVSGSSDLFTLEFFRLAKSRMQSGGVFVQWLQLYCIDDRLLTNLIATFQQVFPETYIIHPRNSGDVILVGMQDKRAQPGFLPKILERDLHQAGMATAVLETLRQAPGTCAKPLDYDFILAPVDVASYLKAHSNVEFNSDGRIATEYQLPQELMFEEANINGNIRNLECVRTRR